MMHIEDRRQIEADLSSYYRSQHMLEQITAQYGESYPVPTWAREAPRVSGVAISDRTPQLVADLLQDREYARLRQLVSAIERLHERLGMGHRRVLELSYFAGRDDEDVALEIGTSTRTVQRRKEHIVYQAAAELRLSGILTYKD